MADPAESDSAKVRQSVPIPVNASRKRKAGQADAYTISYTDATDADRVVKSEPSSDIELEIETTEASEALTSPQSPKSVKMSPDHPTQLSATHSYSELRSVMKIGSMVYFTVEKVENPHNEHAENSFAAIKEEQDVESEEFLSERSENNDVAVGADALEEEQPSTSNAQKVDGRPLYKSRVNDLPEPIFVNGERPHAVAGVREIKLENYAECSDSSSVMPSKSKNGNSESCVLPDKLTQGNVLYGPSIKIAKSRNDTSEPKETWSEVAAKKKSSSIDSFTETGKILNEMSDNSFTEDHSMPVNNRRVPPTVSGENARIVTTIDKSDEILSFLSKIDDRLSDLSDRVDSISTQVDFMMDAMASCGPTYESGTPLNIDAPCAKARDRRQLENLEARLDNHHFKQKWIKWLSVNVTRSDCAERRMLSMLDHIMSKELQAQCSWTGASRIKGQHKICVMELRNILAVFRKIGTTQTEIVTQEKLANFFMKKLKNASKRATYTEKRMSTSRVCSQRKEDDNETSN